MTETTQDSLLNATVRRDTSALQDALRAGADANAEHQGVRPLHLAAMLGPAKHIETLLKHGAEVDAVDAMGRTALHTASIGSAADSAQIIQTLIDAGAKVNARDEHEATPLDLASGARHEAASLLLLQAGATCRHDRKAWVRSVQERSSNTPPSPSPAR